MSSREFDESVFPQELPYVTDFTGFLRSVLEIDRSNYRRKLTWWLERRLSRRFPSGSSAHNRQWTGAQAEAGIIEKAGRPTVDGSYIVSAKGVGLVRAECFYVFERQKFVLRLANSLALQPDDQGFSSISEADYAWLNTLPVRSRISASAQSTFDWEALAWRRVFESGRHRDFLFSMKGMGDWDQGNEIRGDFLWRIRWFLATPHPGSWLACGFCEGKGCDQCKKRGYIVS